MNKYAVLIGNSQFPDETDKSKLPDLACPEKDVDGLSTVLASERGEFEVLSLKNQPSYQILRELQRKVKQADSEDLLLLYYSGHGKPNKSGLLHLTTLDTVIAELETSAIPINRVYDILGTGKARKIVIILDCCYSGAAGQGFKGAVDDQLQQLNNARGTYLVTASTELQVAHESAAEGLSLFTKHLIAGLETGEADKDGDGWVSMNELYDYVQSHVVAENPAQQPTKHVKEERGGLFIAKSGRDSRKELAEKMEHYFFDLAKEKRIAKDILLSVLELLEKPQLQLSVIEKQQYALVVEIFERKIEAVEFIRAWDRFTFNTTKLSDLNISTPKRKPDIIVYPKVDSEDWQIIGKYKVKNGLAIDTETGLMWLRFAHGQTWKNATAEGDVKKTNWETAFEVAEEFNKKGGYAGYTNWKLPTLNELQTLLDKSKGKKGNYIDATAFPNNDKVDSIFWLIPNNSFWSSSEGYNNCFGGGVDIYNGEVNYSDRNSSHAIRLVRAGK